MKEFLITTIYNREEDSYSPLNICPNVKIAKRQFVKALEKAEFKADYVLYIVGQIDPFEMKITSLEKHFVGSYEEIVKDPEVTPTAE